MKARKFLALILALALGMGLAVPALGAAATPTATHADYADLLVTNPLTNSPLWEWAWPTIDDTIRRGLFIGYTPYTDAQGNTITNFGPADAVTQAVGLTLCARMMVDKDLREEILSDRLTQMRTVIPGTAKDPDDANAPFMWFRREAAVCLELGIIQESDLISLRDNDRLGATMTKAEFAQYLVRAMGLEDFAKSLNADTLPFQDEQSITREYRPYVKLLSTYGVLTGDENGNFNPNSSMNRAVCATMLSRAIENIVEGREVDLEIPRYADYTWAAGTIKSVDVTSDGHRVLTLTRTFGGEAEYTLPLGVSIHLYNMPGEATDLKAGSYAKLIFASDKTTVADIRVTPAGLLTPIQGSCDEVNQEYVEVNGLRYTLNQFTQISAGGKTGGVEVLDDKAEYTTAKVLSDTHNVAYTLALSGGTRQVDGILAGITTSTGAVKTTTITVNSFNGLSNSYTLPQDVTITADGQSATLLTSHVGKHVILRVDDENLGAVESLELDLGGNYIQGVLNSVATDKDGIRQVQVTRNGDSKRTPYEVDGACAITFDGEEIGYGGLTSGAYVTARLEGGVLTEISAWRSMEEITGTLTGRTYGDPTVLTVTKADGTTAQFSIPLSELTQLTILVEDEKADMTRVNTGDTVKFTLRYHEVTQIDVTPRKADVTGVLDSITSKADGTVQLHVLFSDGSEKTYQASSATTVTREGKAASLSDVQPGVQVSLVTEGNTALSIQLSGTAARQDSVEGFIYSKDDQARIATIVVTLNGQTKMVNVHIISGVPILDVANGTTISSILRLSEGDTIQAFGSYKADGTFEATSVIRK